MTERAALLLLTALLLAAGAATALPLPGHPARIPWPKHPVPEVDLPLAPEPKLNGTSLVKAAATAGWSPGLLGSKAARVLPADVR